MNVPIESAKRIGFNRRCVESIIKCDFKGKTIYQSVHNWLLWSLLSQTRVSHCSEWELTHMEAMVWMEDNNMSSNIYWCVISSFNEEYDLIVRSNICNINCEACASTFFPCHDKLAWEKGRISWGIYQHPTGTQILLSCVVRMFLLASHLILWSQCEGLF